MSNNKNKIFTRKPKLKENLSEQKELIEAPTAGEVFGQEPETPKGETITDILDRCSREARQFYKGLELVAKRGKKLPGATETNKYNPLFIGPTGAGKTSIIRTWARDKGYELITLNMMGDALDFLGVKTINKDYDLKLDDEGTTKKVARVSTVATQAFDPFLVGKTKILFLDEINKTNPRILQSLYDLISFHTVQNGDEVMYLPKLLFTVGAMNPSEYGGGREELDPALKARMQEYVVNYDTEGLAKYLTATLETFVDAYKEELTDMLSGGNAENTEEVEDLKDAYFKYAGRLELVKSLFNDLSKFHWTDAESIANAGELDAVLVPRTLEQAVYNCDGTKNDFIKKVQHLCGIEAASMVENILSTYRDKEHIANRIWGQDYSVHTELETSEEAAAEEEIVNNATEEERAAAEPETSLYDKLRARRRS